METFFRLYLPGVINQSTIQRYNLIKIQILNLWVHIFPQAGRIICLFSYVFSFHNSTVFSHVDSLASSLFHGLKFLEVMTWIVMSFIVPRMWSSLPPIPPSMFFFLLNFPITMFSPVFYSIDRLISHIFIQCFLRLSISILNVSSMIFVSCLFNCYIFTQCWKSLRLKKNLSII